MKKFIFKTALFLIVLSLFILPPFLILKSSGENFKDLKGVIKKNNNYLIGYAYNENNYGYLKWLSINENKKHQILALGSSRVLQFRKNMFQSSFYNAGYTISTIGDFKSFLEGINIDKYPKYLILGLDQWMFNVNYNNGIVVGRPKYYWSNNFSKYPRPHTYLSVYKSLFNGKYGLDIIKNSSSNKIGLNALINNKGFRNDGSIYYGSEILKLINRDVSANDFKFTDTFSRIKNGNKRFEYSDKVNDLAFDELHNLLSFCKKNNIDVVAFTPPFANSVYDKMVSSNKYLYIDSLESKLQKVFNKYNYEFYNYSSGELLGSNDDQFIDGFHGGEVVYTNILIDMLKKNSILNEVSSVNNLETDKKNKKNRFTLYK